MLPQKKPNTTTKQDLFWTICFIYLCSDAILTYLISSWFGQQVPVTFVVVPFLGLYVLKYGINKLGISLRTWMALLYLASMFVYCWALVQTEPEVIEAFGSLTKNLVSLTTAISAFVVGFATVKNLRNANLLLNALLLVSAAHALICAIALLKIVPGIFPLNESYFWITSSGTRMIRPEITTDQNLQVFYFLPLAPLVIVQKNRILMLIGLIGLAAATYTLITLQTRSGTLVMAGCVCLSMLVPAVNRAVNRRNKILLVVLSAMVVAFLLESVLELSEGLWYRLQATTSSSAAAGRWVSNLYLLERLFDPRYWLPVGMGEFARMYHGFPHSNATAFFLEAGLYGLIFWVVFAFWPAINNLKHLLVTRNTGFFMVIAVVSLGMMIAQLSLQVSLTKQVWLWFGTSLAAMRLRYESTLISKPERQVPNLHQQIPNFQQPPRF